MDSWSEDALNWLVSGMPGPVRWRDIQRAWAMAAEQAQKTPEYQLYLNDFASRLWAGKRLNNPGFSFEGITSSDPQQAAGDALRLKILRRAPERYLAEFSHNSDIARNIRSAYNKSVPFERAVIPQEVVIGSMPVYDKMFRESSVPPGMVLTRILNDKSRATDFLQPGYIFNDQSISSWTHAPSHAFKQHDSVVLRTLPMQGGEKFFPVGKLQDEWRSPRHQNFKVVARDGFNVTVVPWGEDPSAVMYGQPKPVPAVQNYRIADPEASRWSSKNGKLTYDATGRVHAGTPRPQTPRPSPSVIYEMMQFPGSNMYVRSNPMLKAISNPYLMPPMAAASMYADARQQGASRKEAAIQAGVNTGVGASVLGALYAGLGRFAPAAQAPAMHALGGTVSGAALGNDLERIATGNYNHPTSWTGGILGGLGGAAASVTPYGRAAAIGYGLGSLVEPFVRPVVAPAMDFAVNKVFDPSMNYVKGLLGYREGEK